MAHGGTRRPLSSAKAASSSVVVSSSSPSDSWINGLAVTIQALHSVQCHAVALLCVALQVDHEQLPAWLLRALSESAAGARASESANAPAGMRTCGSRDS